jgi:hypothetical protein
MDGKERFFDREQINEINGKDENFFNAKEAAKEAAMRLIPHLSKDEAQDLQDAVLPLGDKEEEK